MLVLVPTLLALGLWQLDRAGQRRALHERMARAEAAAPVIVRSWEQLTDLPDWTRVRLRGQFLSEPHILLDNQLHRGQPGYHVFTPLQQGAESPVLLVNRGWVPTGLDRRFAPRLESAARGTTPLSGTLKPFPFSGIRLRELPPERLASGIYRVHSLRREALQEQLGREIRLRILRLDAESPGGYLRAWAPLRSPAARNVAYALQYFAMALVVLVVFIMLRVQARENPEEQAQ